MKQAGRAGPNRGQQKDRLHEPETHDVTCWMYLGLVMFGEAEGHAVEPPEPVLRFTLQFSRWKG